MIKIIKVRINRGQIHFAENVGKCRHLILKTNAKTFKILSFKNSYRFWNFMVKIRLLKITFFSRLCLNSRVLMRINVLTSYTLRYFRSNLLLYYSMQKTQMSALTSKGNKAFIHIYSEGMQLRYFCQIFKYVISLNKY